MSDKIEIIIDEVSYTGWESVSMSRAITSLCGSFEVTLADEDDGKDWRLVAKKNCVIKLGGEKLLTGFIDSVEFSVEESSHQVTLKGRDLTADLVDCAVIADKKGNPFFGTIKNSDLREIIQKLTTPYGTLVNFLQEPGDKFTRFAIQRGETAFEALDRACKLRGVIAITNPDGNLIVTSSGQGRSSDILRWKVNVLSAKGTYDYTNRFTHYRVEAQAAGTEGTPVGDTWRGTTNIFGAHTDIDAPRYRPTIIGADAEATKVSCKKRAAAEALYRAANSQTFEVSVAGWHQNDGTVWRENRLVNVDIPPLYVKEELLIVGIDYRLDGQEGAKTAFKLYRKDAFDANLAIDALQVKDPPGTRLGWASTPSSVVSE